ncbi:MAG: hypothetical protein RM347_017705 [Nostoc sp. ChiQUE02]|uniref:hypothetical protein n=1 Tax=Nostoc sp. ChiQUE02 TaxID=3075377 RepID=UPI002AD586AA|nr:hypothetical protein [Nostoc sp. ChiQUE02]MDZ8233744.1 hypothetical protein [Nostoc sp. ChiQUE02]
MTKDKGQKTKDKKKKNLTSKEMYLLSITLAVERSPPAGIYANATNDALHVLTTVAQQG